METEVGIDGESLGLVVIDKCDAIKSILYSLFHTKGFLSENYHTP